MNKRRFFILFLLVVLLFSFVSGCAGVSRIDSFFANEEFKEHSKTIDFGLFFVMFFALAYIGLSKVWGEGFGKPGGARGAIIGLSLALALALAFSIVSQTSFSITTIFPLAKALFFFIIFFILWGLLVMSGIFGKHWGGKLIAAILALIATYLLFCIATHMICQMSDNMDDPACESDFFNAFFNVAGRFFGIDDWTWDGLGGGGWIRSKGAKKGPPPPDAEIQGGCRLDITFQYDSTNPVAGAGKLMDYINAVNAMGKKKIYVYGFASEEGTPSHNRKLSKDRAEIIAGRIRNADPNLKVYAKPKGETKRFGSVLEDNRRVVIAISSVSSFMPAPGPGDMPGCPKPEEPVCGDNVMQSPEDCDGTDDAKCPGKCLANCTCPVVVPPIPPTCKNNNLDSGEACDPTVPTSCPTGEHCADDCSKCMAGPTPDGWWSWWYLLPLLILLLILLGFLGFRAGYHSYHRRFHGVDIDNLNDRILQLIRLAIAKMLAISRTVRQGDLSDAEKQLFQDAVRYRGLLLHERIRRNLGPSGVRGTIFAPGLAHPDRTALIENVYRCTSALRRLQRILTSRVRFFFWPRLWSINRAERELTRAHVSPVVHHDARVTFTYVDNAGGAQNVQVRLSTAPSGGSYQNFDMMQTPGTNTWTFTTNVLTHGTYNYKFRIQRGGVWGFEWDAGNPHRNGPNPVNGFNEAEVADIMTLARGIIPRI